MGAPLLGEAGGDCGGVEGGEEEETERGEGTKEEGMLSP